MCSSYASFQNRRVVFDTLSGAIMLSYQDSPECMMEKLLQANVETNSPWPDCEKHIHSRQKTSIGNRNKKVPQGVPGTPTKHSGPYWQKIGVASRSANGRRNDIARECH